MEFEVVQSVDLVKDLLPLLDDATRPPDRDDELSIAEAAASKIAALLGRELTIDEYDKPQQKACKLKQIRTWAEAAAKRRPP